VSGSNTVLQAGVYGTQGTPSLTNVPGARDFAMSWTDLSGNFWLFGGRGLDSTGSDGELNDLWKFDGANWTWVSGADLINQMGVYGTKGTASPANMPGAREGGSTWIDASGNLWLFGGNGHDSQGIDDYLSDLWKFDGTNWTWVSGMDTSVRKGTYGTRGVTSPSNVLGSRVGALTWIDSGGNLWLFGGYGWDSLGSITGELNDLWKFDGTNWTWMNGYNTRNHSGQYGTLGAADPTNLPGTRDSSVTWVDKSGNFWLFGGYGIDFSLGWSDLNDAWKYDGTNWTWMGGGQAVEQPGVYGTRGTSSPSNIPGARDSSAWAIDSAGNLWLSGGFGFDSNTQTQFEFNDLWKFDGANWTWIAGANTAGQTGVYGTQGTPAQSNVPGARGGHVAWMDRKGDFLLLGGFGFDSTATVNLLNDLWRFEP
jgi:N-acetylneuraminic acid mutarotase